MQPPLVGISCLSVLCVAQHIPHFSQQCQHATSAIDNIVQVAKGRAHICCAYVSFNSLAHPGLNGSSVMQRVVKISWLCTCMCTYQSFPLFIFNFSRHYWPRGAPSPNSTCSNQPPPTPTRSNWAWATSPTPTCSKWAQAAFPTHSNQPTPYRGWRYRPRGRRAGREKREEGRRGRGSTEPM